MVGGETEVQVTQPGHAGQHPKRSEKKPRLWDPPQGFSKQGSPRSDLGCRNFIYRWCREESAALQARNERHGNSSCSQEDGSVLRTVSTPNVPIVYMQQNTHQGRVIHHQPLTAWTRGKVRSVYVIVRKSKQPPREEHTWEEVLQVTGAWVCVC